MTERDPAPVPDAAQRSRALDTRRSFIVQAPAGSGKTELLIQRALALLAQVQAPEEIVAITFTRKAAGEMRARILQALESAATETPPGAAHEHTTWRLARAALQRDAQAGWGIGASPNRLRIHTIDALCAALARQMPLLSDFGALPKMVEDADGLYREAARRTLALLHEPEDAATPMARAAARPAGKAVAQVLAHLDNDLHNGELLLADMLRSRDQWIRHVADRDSPRLERPTLEAGLAGVIRDALQGLRSLVPAALQDDLLALARFAAANLLRDGRSSLIVVCAGLTALPGAEPEDLTAWRGLTELLLTRDGEPRKQADAKLGFPPPTSEKKNRVLAAQLQRAKDRHEALVNALAGQPELVDALQRVRTLPPPAYTDAQWATLDAVTALLPVAMAQLALVFGERGRLDFTAVAQAAVRALGSDEEPTDLALALDYRISHLLVDEFQDTSQSQYELLTRLTAGWQADDGRTLFVVGDPMQSIYRFREAEVALYLRARRQGIGGVALEPLTLGVNFRSQAGLVSWVNGAFRSLLPHNEDVESGAVPFVSSQPLHPALEGPAVQVHPLLENDRDAEARAVLEIVQAARREDAQGSIAILVRSRTHLAAIVPALREAGLRFQAIEIEALAHRPVVQDLRVLTRALLHPADRIAWLAVLRAPWCGLTVADLDALARPDRRACLWELMDRPALLAQLSEDGRARLVQLRETLRHALAQRRRTGLRRWIEGAWLALGGPAAARDEADLEDAQVFLGLLDELERGGDLPDFAELDEHIAKLYALPDPAAAAGLQVMTIHKAKGLEFDVVVLPGLGYAPQATAPRLLRWLERPRAQGRADLLLAPIREPSQDSDPIYRYLDSLDTAQGEHEDGRLLYVAATRAKRRLHLLGHANLNKEGAPTPASRCLLQRLWPVLRGAFEAAAEQKQRPDAAQPSAPVAPTTVLQRLAPGWRLPAPEPVAAQAPGRSPFGELGMVEPVEFSWASETARHIGTAVHRALLRIAQDGIANWSAARVSAMRNLFARDLIELGVPAAQLDMALDRVTSALGLTLEDQRARWILSPHADAASELRLTGVVDGAIVNLAVDRTFVDERGIRWVVDYKTGRHEGGSLETFLEREQQRYRAQLERYATVLHNLDRRPVRMALYFPLLQAWREWGADC
ncbi:MAG TPA: UvrD-helicase domain-containing protein [Burkholderiales bacterium]|nr:UvrD-helicase domain-containing protein [Burkholderiales bacterium]